jgi:hypothetical protein
MKIIDALKLKGKPAHIPNCSRKELPIFLKKRGYKVGAEIGVYKGEYTIHFCKAGLKIFAIDPWRTFAGQGRTQNRQKRQDFLFGHAKRYLKPYKNVTFVRKASMDALDDFKDGSLDFVYIDGDHDFRHIAEDIFEWSKKVRAGGIVSGHDYYCTIPQARNVICQVQYVVDAYVKTYKIENFYTFGNTNPSDRRGDSTKSWFWIKK